MTKWVFMTFNGDHAFPARQYGPFKSSDEADAYLHRLKKRPDAWSVMPLKKPRKVKHHH